MTRSLETLVPPHSIEAEMSVLGAILQSNEAFLKCLEILKPEHFYRDAHRKIWEAAVDVSRERGEQVDLITMTNELRGRGDLEEIGSHAYLTALEQAVGTTANVAYHARIVREKAEARRALALALRLAQSASVDNGWRDTLAELAALGSESAAGGFALQPLDLRTLDSAPPPPRWAIADRVGIGDIALLSGDSGSYKTWLGLQLAIDLSCERSIFGQFSHPGSEFSRIMIIDEENHGDLLRRRLALLTRGADLSEEGLTQVCDRVQIFAGSGFCLDNECAYQVLRRELARLRPAFLILDSLVRVHTGDENSATDISRLYLTRLAPLRREFHLTILVLHHTRKHRKDDSSEPGQMLRGSGDLRAMCDSHLQLRRIGPGTVSVIADKCRHSSEAPPFLLEIIDTDNGGVAVRHAGEPEQRLGSRDAVKMRIVAFLGREIEAELAGIIEAIGRDRKAVTRALEALQGEGIVERPSRGRYRLVQESA